MKYTTSILTLLLSFITASAQPDKANMDFEQLNPYNSSFSSWNPTAFSHRPYRVFLDSNEKHQGRYSLCIKYDPNTKVTSDGQVTNWIPVDVTGKKIRISCYAKTMYEDDTAMVTFSVNQEKTGIKRANKGFGIKPGPGWNYYSHEFSMDTFHMPIYGVLIISHLRGKGAVWLDDFSIEVDGKNILASEPMPSAKGEIVKPLTTQQATNLEILCRVWGFLKYFHPRVATGKINADGWLFKMIPLAKKAKDNNELSTLLSTQVDSLGEIPACKDCYTKIPDSVITYNLDQAWMSDDKLITKSLQNKLQYILANRHMGNGYYARYNRTQNLLFPNENEYKWREMVYPNEIFRLIFLFRYWNIIEYFSPYKNIIGKNWGSVLKDFIPAFATARDSLEYQVAVNKLVNSVNDSHSGAFNPVLAKEYTDLYLPVQVKVIDDNVVITQFYNDSLARLYDLQKGDVITRINKKTIKQIIDERIDLVNGSNYPTKLRSLAQLNYITGGKESSINITYLREGKEYTSMVKRYPFADLNYKYKQETIKWKMLDDNIGYVNMGILERKDVDSMMKQLRNTRAIIFDIRNYPRSTAYPISTYLYERPTEFAKMTYPNLNYPGTFLWLNKIQYGPAVPDQQFFHYKGKVLILVNETTQSHAEWTTMVFQAVPDAVTIGSQTAGADGDASSLYLPGNFFSYLTGLGVFYPDGSPTQRKGVRVDVEVNPTVKGIKEGRDEVLEKALEVLNKR